MAPRQRKLAAILFSDLVGYTARMGEDERRAISAVQRARREQRALVEQYGGDWLQEIGDGALCTFPSAVDAVDCAAIPSASRAWPSTPPSRATTRIPKRPATSSCAAWRA